MKVDAFFGDYTGSRVFAVDINNWSVVKEIPTADGPYPVDQAETDVLPITREVQELPVIAIQTLAERKRIHLSHTPRSTAFHKPSQRLLVAGGNKSMTSIIDIKHGRVLQKVGDDRIVTHRRDFGGDLASGHPKWVSEDSFLHLDRVSRTLALYKIDGQLLDEIHTPTSLHHVFSIGRVYYGCCEGNPASHIPPSLFRFEIEPRKLVVTGNSWLPSIDDKHAMGGHHIDLHPNKTHIYFGSTEGRLFVIDRHTLKVIKVIHTGRGTGHTGFSTKRNRAFVINHDDTFISVIDTQSYQVLGHINVASSLGDAAKKYIGHTFSVNERTGKYYCLASRDGKLVEIDMDSLKINRTLEFDKNGSYTLQGCFLQ